YVHSMSSFEGGDVFDSILYTSIEEAKLHVPKLLNYVIEQHGDPAWEDVETQGDDTVVAERYWGESDDKSFFLYVAFIIEMKVNQ
ncbi:MAG: hypothetical protein ACWGQW_06685, partial [bacterium]